MNTITVVAALAVGLLLGVAMVSPVFSVSTYSFTPVSDHPLIYFESQVRYGAVGITEFARGIMVWN